MSVRQLKAPPNPNAILCLEQVLEKAKSGEVQGVLVLMEYDGALYHDDSGGRLNYGSLLAAFERWKFKWLAEENLERAR